MDSLQPLVKYKIIASPVRFAKWRGIINEDVRLIEKGIDKDKHLIDGHPHGINSAIYSLLIQAISVLHKDSLTVYDISFDSIKRLYRLFSEYRHFENEGNSLRLLFYLLLSIHQSSSDRDHLIDLRNHFYDVLNEKEEIQILLSKHGFKEIQDHPKITVHDSRMSIGSASQLVLSAFILGAKQLTIVYTNVLRTANVKDAIKTAQLLGVHLHLSYEFSEGNAHHRLHYQIRLPHESAKNIESFLRLNHVDSLIKLNHEKESQRKSIMNRLLQEFNDTSLSKYNQGYENLPKLQLLPLNWDKFLASFPLINPSKRHLAIFLKAELEKVYEHRMKALFQDRNVLLRHLVQHFSIETAYQLIQLLKRREQLEFDISSLDTIALDRQHFSDWDYTFEMKNFSHIVAQFSEWNHPMTLIAYRPENIKSCLEKFIHLYPSISSITLFLNKEYSVDNRVKISNQLNLLVQYVQNKKLDSNRILSLLQEDFGVTDVVARSFLRKLSQFQVPITINIQEQIADTLKDFDPAKLPFYVDTPQVNFVAHQPVLASLSSSEMDLISKYAKLGLAELIDNWKYVRHLDIRIRNLLVLSAAIPPITIVPDKYMIPPEYLPIWFGITLGRNLFTDMISYGSPNPAKWRADYINWSKASDSLLLTAWSIPLIMLVYKQTLAIAKEYGVDSSVVQLAMPASEVLAIFAANLANGIYKYTENMIRGLSQKTRIMNFFRGFFAFMMTSLTSPLLRVVDPIVLNKFWGDTFGTGAAFIGQYQQYSKLRHRNVEDILKTFIMSGAVPKYAFLDVVQNLSLRSSDIVDELMENGYLSPDRSLTTKFNPSKNFQFNWQKVYISRILADVFNQPHVWNKRNIWSQLKKDGFVDVKDRLSNVYSQFTAAVFIENQEKIRSLFSKVQTVLDNDAQFFLNKNVSIVELLNQYSRKTRKLDHQQIAFIDLMYLIDRQANGRKEFRRVILETANQYRQWKDLNAYAEFVNDLVQFASFIPSRADHFLSHGLHPKYEKLQSDLIDSRSTLLKDLSYLLKALGKREAKMRQLQVSTAGLSLFQ